MELIQVIALLCQIHPAIGDKWLSYGPDEVSKHQTQCQQSYLNCTLKRSSMTQAEALQRCILEK